MPPNRHSLPSPGTSRHANWRGASGADHAVRIEAVDSFTMEEGRLYLLALGDTAAWVGGARDVIEDHQARARFRAALAVARAAYSCPAPGDPVERLSLAYDLAAGRRAPVRSAA